jgi:hypothetical protein
MRIVSADPHAPQLPRPDWAHLPERIRATLEGEGIRSAADWLKLSAKARSSIFGIPRNTRRMLDSLARALAAEPG